MLRLVLTSRADVLNLTWLSLRVGTGTIFWHTFSPFPSSPTNRQWIAEAGEKGQGEAGQGPCDHSLSPGVPSPSHVKQFMCFSRCQMAVDFSFVGCAGFKLCTLA